MNVGKKARFFRLNLYTLEPDSTCFFPGYIRYFKSSYRLFKFKTFVGN